MKKQQPAEQLQLFHHRFDYLVSQLSWFLRSSVTGRQSSAECAEDILLPKVSHQNKMTHILYI